MDNSEKPPSYLLITYHSITPPNFTIYIIYLTILKSFYYYSALVSNLNWNNVLFVTDCQPLKLKDKHYICIYKIKKQVIFYKLKCTM
jgi:hypothetical protein